MARLDLTDRPPPPTDLRADRPRPGRHDRLGRSAGPGPAPPHRPRPSRRARPSQTHRTPRHPNLDTHHPRPRLRGHACLGAPAVPHHRRRGPRSGQLEMAGPPARRPRPTRLHPERHQQDPRRPLQPTASPRRPGVGTHSLGRTRRSPPHPGRLHHPHHPAPHRRQGRSVPRPAQPPPTPPAAAIAPRPVRRSQPLRANQPAMKNVTLGTIATTMTPRELHNLPHSGLLNRRSVSSSRTTRRRFRRPNSPHGIPTSAPYHRALPTKYSASRYVQATMTTPTIPYPSATRLATLGARPTCPWCNAAQIPHPTRYQSTTTANGTRRNGNAIAARNAYTRSRGPSSSRTRNRRAESRPSRSARRHHATVAIHAVTVV